MFCQNILILTLSMIPIVQSHDCSIYTSVSLKMLVADCSKKDHDEVSRSLNSDIKILSYHHNYIKKLEDDSFANYKNLYAIYMDRNSIVSISNHAFINLKNLYSLNLAYNVLPELPQNLPPSLKILTLDGNKFIKEFKSKSESPIFKIPSTINLEILRISSCELTKFPKFDKMSAKLRMLNITLNEISRITPDDLAPLCSLKTLYVDTNKLFKLADSSDKEYCECLQFQIWTDKLNINVDGGFTCRQQGNKVPQNCDISDKNSTLEIHNQCLVMVDKLTKESAMRTLVTYGSISISVLLCVIIFRRICFKQKSHQNSHNCVDASRVLYDVRTPTPVHMRTTEQNLNISTLTSPHDNMWQSNKADDVEK